MASDFDFSQYSFYDAMPECRLNEVGDGMCDADR